MYINIYGCNKYSSGQYYVKSKYRSVNHYKHHEIVIPLEFRLDGDQ